MINFKSIPFLKILLPYTLGICCAFYFGVFKNIHVVFFSSVFLWLVAFIFQRLYKATFYFKKGIFIFCTNILLFLLAFESCYLHNAKNNGNHYSHRVSYAEQKIVATITDIPVTTQKFIKIPVQINCIEQNNKWHYTEGNTIVYLKNDSTLKLHLGTKILLNTKFSHVNEPKNPNEFDYKMFLQNKNIFHVVYAKSLNTFIVSETSSVFDYATFGVKIKSKLVSVLRNSGLSQQAFSISSALLVGYDDEIDSEVMQSFSHSGTLHILSVSGMHTGVLYAILVFMFSKFDKHDRYKKTKLAFVLFFLLLFILVTGLSPSVLRAGIMLSLVLIGKTFYKQGNGYNTLVLSAFLSLLVNPYLIIDVGFLLSYMAVFGIMFLYPILAKLYIFENKIVQWFWTSVLISVAATLFTLPISLYFFHQFPIWFVFSNLLIIPISMLIMLGAALFLIVYKVAFLNQILVYVINASTSIMLWLAQLTDNTSYGFIDFIPFSKIDALFMMVAIALSLIVTAQKQYKSVLILCTVFITWLSISVFNTYQQKYKNEFIVFHIKQKSVYAIRVGQTVYTNLGGITNNEFQRYVKPYLLSISNLKMVNSKSNIIKIGANAIFCNNKLNELTLAVKPNYLLVSNNTPLQLTTNYKSKALIIADCSNSYNFTKKLKKQCQALDIPFYSVKESGAFQIQL